MSNIKHILSPFSEADFFSDFWEQNPLHINRSSTEYFSSLLSLDDIEILLSSQALHFPGVQLTRLAHNINLSDYTDESHRILPHRLIEKHHEGATIVFSQAHEKIPSLADFRRDIQSELNMRCQTNVYLSPQGNQGFNVHFDSHDVFILQISGSKTFNFYEGGVDLPYKHDSFNSTTHNVGTLTQSITLETGDTLYIPRGVLHDAVATDETSLHITLGVYTTTLQDVLIEMAQLLTDKDPHYRKSVPRDWLSLANETDIPLTDQIHDILTPALTITDLKEALSSIADSHAINSAPNCHGMLRPTTNSDFGVKTIQLAVSHLTGVERFDTLIRLRTHGQVLEFNEPLRTIIEELLNGKTLNLNDWVGLNAEQRQLLYTRLLHANLLIV